MWLKSRNRRDKEMKTIVDQETGELIEIEEENEIVTRKLYEIGAITDDTADFIENYLTIKEQYEIFTHKLEQAMRENNIKKWDNDYFTVTLTDESIQKRVDNERLKKDGLYEKYLKLVNVKGGIRVKFKGRN